MPNKKNGIEKFIEAQSKKNIIAIQGLGFVGSVMAMVCANAIKGDYLVFGVDLPSTRGKKIIDSLNNGIFPLVAEDPKIEELFKRTIKKGNFFATTDVTAFKFADTIIVDINLDVEKTNKASGQLVGFNVDLSNFKNAIRSIGENCKENALILVETTVPPGTCSKLVKPIIEDSLKKRNLPTNQIKIGHSYERVMPGPGYVDSIQNFYRVYSGLDKRSADAVESFLHTIIRTDKYPLTRLSNTNATEMAKVLENSYRAQNIAFMVEWSRFAEESGVNIYEVIDAIRLRPTHSNLMYPGIGVGGYCLTKDALLASWSRQKLITKNDPLSQSEAAISINDQMPHFAFEFLIKIYPKLKNSNILLLGISYRGDVGDTRSTPVQLLFDKLLEVKAKVSCHDPYVEYWEEKQMAINKDLMNHLNNSYDIIIISTGHSLYKEKIIINKLLSLKSILIYDTVGLLNLDQIKILSEKHTIKVLGRGDL